MEKVKEIFSSKMVEASTYLKGMTIHEEQVAFLGLDDRTRVMVQHFLNAGVKIRLWEPKQKSASERQLGGENVAITESLLDAIKPVHVVFVAVSKAEMDEIIEDEGTMKSFHNKTVVMCTSMSVTESGDLNDLFTKGGATYMEAACCGSHATAEKAQLKVLIGSVEDQFSRMKPIFSLFGTPYYVGAVPKATAVKQSVDFVLAAENAALALAAAYLRKHGQNTYVFLDIMKQVRGCDLAKKFTSFEQRNYASAANGFSNDEVLLDLTNMIDESAVIGMDSSMLTNLKTYTEQAKQMSGGDTDIASVYDVLNPPVTSALPAK